MKVTQPTMTLSKARSCPPCPICDRNRPSLTKSASGVVACHVSTIWICRSIGIWSTGASMPSEERWSSNSPTLSCRSIPMYLVTGRFTASSSVMAMLMQSQIISAWASHESANLALSEEMSSECAAEDAIRLKAAR